MSRDPFDNLIGVFAMHCRRHAVASLLRGCDVQCFTTAQYQAAYLRENPGSAISVECATMHLRSLQCEVKEVKPGVWASCETVCGLANTLNREA